MVWTEGDVQDWPIVCRGLLSYPVEGVGGDGQPLVAWTQEHIAAINLIASNVPKLGNDHPISDREYLFVMVLLFS